MDVVARTQPRTSLQETVSQTMTMAWRSTKKMRRNPEQFFDVTIQPLLFTAMFAYIFGGAISGSVQDYLPIVITGILAQTALTACMATGIQLREDMDKGVFDRFKALPIARIAPLTGPARAFIGNSGAEAVEAGLKLARYHTRRPNLIAFLGAFHGRTMGAVSLTASKAKYHAHFGPLMPGVYHVPFGNEGLEEIEQRIFKRLMPADEFAAVIVEPIQGEGGYVVPEDDFLPRLRALCDRHGILLIADEVQSGAGRTGKMWAIQHWDVEPDILLTAKGIASGMPIGAMIARADIMSWGPGAHGSTYGGNPVALAAMLETIRLLEEGLIANAGIRGREIMEGLAPLLDRFPGLVRDVRGKGLMIGVQFDSGETAEAVQMQAFDRGLLVLEAGDDCVRMSPPLIVSQAEAETAVRIFMEAVAHVATHRREDVGQVRRAVATGLAVPGVEAAG